MASSQDHRSSPAAREYSPRAGCCAAAAASHDASGDGGSTTSLKDHHSSCFRTIADDAAVQMTHKTTPTHQLVLSHSRITSPRAGRDVVTSRSRWMWREQGHSAGAPPELFDDVTLLGCEVATMGELMLRTCVRLPSTRRRRSRRHQGSRRRRGRRPPPRTEYGGRAQRRGVRRARVEQVDESIPYGGAPAGRPYAGFAT